MYNREVILATNFWRQQDPVLSTVIPPPASSFARAGSAYRHYPIGDQTRLEEVGTNVLRCSWQRNPDTGLRIRGFHGEPVRTNLSVYNTEIDNAAWSKDGATVVDNSIVLPDGNIADYDVLHEETSTGLHRIYDQASLSTGMACLSLYLRPVNRDYFYIALGSSWAYLDLSSASIYSASGIINGAVESLGNDWYRGWLSASYTAGGQWVSLLCVKTLGSISYTGDGIDATMVWGVQTEMGEYPSSLIITGASPVSRTEDSDYQVAAPLPDARQGWLSTKVYITPHTNSAEIPLLTLSDGGSAADRIRLVINTSQNLELQSACSGGDAGLVEGAGVMDGRIEGHDVYLTWRPGELCLAVDGVFGTSDHVVSIPENLDRLNIHASGAIVGDVQMGDRFSRVPWQHLAAA